MVEQQYSNRINNKKRHNCDRNDKVTNQSVNLCIGQLINFASAGPAPGQARPRFLASVALLRPAAPHARGQRRIKYYFLVIIIILIIIMLIIMIIMFPSAPRIPPHQPGIRRGIWSVLGGSWDIPISIIDMIVVPITRIIICHIFVITYYYYSYYHHYYYPHVRYCYHY